MFCFNTSRRTLRYFLFSTNPACPFGVAEYEIIEIAENFANGGQRHGKMVTFQNRPAHNRPFRADHVHTDPFITDPLITDHVHNRQVDNRPRS